MRIRREESGKIRPILDKTRALHGPFWGAPLRVPVLWPVILVAECLPVIDQLWE